MIAVEEVDRWLTRMLPVMEHLSYQERLVRIGLFSLGLDIILCDFFFLKVSTQVQQVENKGNGMLALIAIGIEYS